MQRPQETGLWRGIQVKKSENEVFFNVFRRVFDVDFVMLFVFLRIIKL